MNPIERSDEDTAGINPRFWQMFGGLFVAATFLLLAAAFIIGDISCDRWLVLSNIYPIFAGISAGAFLGTITVRGNLFRLSVVAGGGFAVFLLCFYFTRIPDRCVGVRIGDFRVFDDQFSTGKPGHQVLTRLRPKRGVVNVEDVDRFALYIGFVISNFSTISPDRTKIHVTVSGADDSGSRYGKPIGTSIQRVIGFEWIYQQQSERAFS